MEKFAQIAMKCADLGHLAAPCQVHKRWVNDLKEEFFRQGDAERERGMKVSALMDRQNEAAGGVSKSQVLPDHSLLAGAWQNPPHGGLLPHASFFSGSKRPPIQSI